MVLRLFCRCDLCRDCLGVARMNEDTEHAQLAQAELEERAQREDNLLRHARFLTELKKLTDEEHRIAYEQFTQTINGHIRNKR